MVLCFNNNIIISSVIWYSSVLNSFLPIHKTRHSDEEVFVACQTEVIFINNTEIQHFTRTIFIFSYLNNYSYFNWSPHLYDVMLRNYYTQMYLNFVSCNTRTNIRIFFIFYVSLKCLAWYGLSLFQSWWCVWINVKRRHSQLMFHFGQDLHNPVDIKIQRGGSTERPTNNLVEMKL